MRIWIRSLAYKFLFFVFDYFLSARDKLAKMAKSMDARQKLERIRNLKDGKLEVKKLGAITLTKKTGGKIMLTTNKGAAAAARAAPAEVSFGCSELWIQIH